MNIDVLLGIKIFLLVSLTLISLETYRNFHNKEACVNTPKPYCFTDWTCPHTSDVSDMVHPYDATVKKIKELKDCYDDNSDTSSCGCKDPHDRDGSVPTISTLIAYPTSGIPSSMNGVIEGISGIGNSHTLTLNGNAVPPANPVPETILFCKSEGGSFLSTPNT